MTGLLATAMIAVVVMMLLALGLVFQTRSKVAIALTVVMVAFYSALLVAIFHQRF